MRKLFFLLPLFSFTALLPACGGGPAAAIAGEPTTVKEAFGAKCDASQVQPQSAPDLMAWDSAARANLSRLRDKGIVAVRYEKKGCDISLELLPGCKGSGSYRYTPYNATESKTASSENELFAALPLGASSVAARVKKGQTLRTDYTMVGTDALPADKHVSRASLRGPDCARATHVVSTVYLGGFALAAGTKAELGGSAKVFGLGTSGSSQAAGERLVAEGSAEACAEAQKTGKEEKLCAVPLRVGLLALDGLASDGSGVAKPPASSGATPTGPCPTGMARIPAGSLTPAFATSRVDLGSVCLDTTEVTAEAYEKCVVDGHCSAPTQLRSTSERVFCNYRAAGREKHPINCVTVEQAKGYCQAQAKLLPTLAELEWATRGNVMRTHAWGEEPPEGRACFGQKGTCPVGSFAKGATPEGVLDLAGNVEEFAETGSGFASFGGGYASEPSRLVGKQRRSSEEPSPTVGFRCVSR